jgi:hypothetical protein
LIQATGFGHEPSPLRFPADRNGVLEVVRDYPISVNPEHKSIYES